MDPEHFLDFVRQEFAPLADKHGMREVATIEPFVLKEILYTNTKRAIQFYLDVRDGYLDAVYSDAAIYKPDGHLVEPVIESWNKRRSVRALIRSEGVTWPDRETGLFKPGVLEKAVRDMIEGIERHSKEIFREGGSDTDQ